MPTNKLFLGLAGYSKGWGGVEKSSDGLYKNSKKFVMGYWDDPSNPNPSGNNPWFKLKELEGSG